MTSLTARTRSATRAGGKPSAAARAASHARASRNPSGRQASTEVAGGGSGNGSSNGHDNAASSPGIRCVKPEQIGHQRVVFAYSVMGHRRRKPAPAEADLRTRCGGPCEPRMRRACAKPSAARWRSCSTGSRTTIRCAGRTLGSRFVSVSRHSVRSIAPRMIRSEITIAVTHTLPARWNRGFALSPGDPVPRR
jgi:hypothetical protein